MTAVLPMEFVSGAPPRSLREFAERQVQQMEASRATMEPWWRECAAFFSPRSPRFTSTQDNRGNRLNRHILDETAIFARRTLSSGLHWGITNPARQWKLLQSPNPDLAEHADVTDWLHTVNQRMDVVLAGSNFYDAQGIAYDDVIVYATAGYLIEEDDTDVIRCVPFAVGSYSIADDEKGRVIAWSRTFPMTVRQLVRRFGKPGNEGMFSKQVQTDIRDKRWEKSYPVTQLICPNEEYDGVRDTPDAKAFKSLYWEPGAKPADTSLQFLADEGYSEWPVILYRWRRAPDEPWGIDCPAMQVLGTNKSVQRIESKALKLIDKAVDPPLVGPSSLMNKRVSLLPGDLTTDDDREKQLRAIHDVKMEGLVAVREAQQDMRARIHDAFYTRLILFIANDPRAARPTAREVSEISEEKYLAFGQVLESFNRPLSDVIDRVFAIMNRRGLIPPAPEVLQGQTLRVDYTSIMAQAQKSVGLSNLRDFAFSVAEIVKATGDPGASLKVDWEQWVDEMAQRSVIPPRVVRSDEDVAAIRTAQARQAEEERRVAMAEQEAAAAKDLAAAPLGTDNALTRLLSAGPAPPEGLP